MATYTVQVTIPTIDTDDPWHEEVEVEAVGAHEACAKARRIIRLRFRVTGVTALVTAADYGAA